MAEHPAALQLRLLQTVVEVAAEKNSTLVLPFPVELLRFLEKPPHNHPGPKTRQSRRPPNRPRYPTARRRMWKRHRSPTTLAVSNSTASKVSHSG